MLLKTASRTSNCFTETIYAKVGNRAINKELTKIMSIYWDFSISFVCPLSSDVTRARSVR